MANHPVRLLAMVNKFADTAAQGFGLPEGGLCAGISDRNPDL